MIRTLLIDNYDSFTNNLYHYLAEVNGCPPVIVRNDWEDWSIGALEEFDNVVISPGPGSPDKSDDFGICAEVIAEARIPILGICLGRRESPWDMAEQSLMHLLRGMGDCRRFGTSVSVSSLEFRRRSTRSGITRWPSPTFPRRWR